MAKNVLYQKIPGYKGLSLGSYKGQKTSYWIVRVFSTTDKKHKEYRLDNTGMSVEEAQNKAIQLYLLMRNFKQEKVLVEPSKEILGSEELSEFLVEFDNKGLFNDDAVVAGAEINEIEELYIERSHYASTFVMEQLYPLVKRVQQSKYKVSYPSIEDFVKTSLQPFTDQTIRERVKYWNKQVPEEERIFYNPPRIISPKGNKTDLIKGEPLEVVASAYHDELIKRIKEQKKRYSELEQIKGYKILGDIEEYIKEGKIHLSDISPLAGFSYHKSNEENEKDCPFYRNLPKEVKDHPKYGVVRKFKESLKKDVDTKEDLEWVDISPFLTKDT